MQAYTNGQDWWGCPQKSRTAVVYECDRASTTDVVSGITELTPCVYNVTVKTNRVW